jgi:hypothetical protein
MDAVARKLYFEMADALICAIAPVGARHGSRNHPRPWTYIADADAFRNWWNSNMRP